MITAEVRDKNLVTTPRRSGSRDKSRLPDLVGVGPPFALFLLFMLIPMIVAIVLSFTIWNGLGNPRWAGFANWSRFFSDSEARTAVVVTAKVVVLSYIVQTPISMALGLFTAGRERYRTVYATIFVIPLLMSTAGIALLWASLLDPNFGAMQSLADSTGLSFLNQNYLGDQNLALYVVVAIIAWQFIPFHTLLYAVGRRQIPAVLYEAALIDGANPWQMFVRVTLPQLRFTIVTSGILMVVGALTYFDIIYIMTNGGPGNSTLVLSLDMYHKAVQANEYGYASVLAVVLGVIGIGIAMGLVRFSGFASMRSQQAGAT